MSQSDLPEWLELEMRRHVGKYMFLDYFKDHKEDPRYAYYYGFKKAFEILSKPENFRKLQNFKNIESLTYFNQSVLTDKIKKLESDKQILIEALEHIEMHCKTTQDQSKKIEKLESALELCKNQRNSRMSHSDGMMMQRNAYDQQIQKILEGLDD
jgi:hypothetical protein